MSSALISMAIVCSIRSSNLLSVPHVHTTFASRGFSVAAPSVWNSLPAGIHACSSPYTFRRLLKPTVLTWPSVPLSGSHKCLRYGLWSTLCNIKDFIYLLTYVQPHPLREKILEVCRCQKSAAEWWGMWFKDELEAIFQWWQLATEGSGGQLPPNLFFAPPPKVNKHHFSSYHFTTRTITLPKTCSLFFAP